MDADETPHFHVQHGTRAKTWLFPLFECRNLHKYVCACLFPCVPMNTVRRLLEDEYGSSDVQSSGAAVGSAVLLDAPCLAGAMVFNHEVEEQLQKLFNGDDGYYEKDNTSWQSVLHSQMSTLSACLACMVYPCLIGPTTCWLRRHALEKAEIHSETCTTTMNIVACCWPCALVQMEEELQGDAHDMKKMHQSLARTRMVL